MTEDTNKTGINPTEGTQGDGNQAPPDLLTPDAPLKGAKAEAERLQEIHNRGYRIEMWNGQPKYCSVFDNFDTTDLGVIQEYVSNHRLGFGLYGDSATAPLSDAQKFAAVSRQGAKKKA